VLYINKTDGNANFLKLKFDHPSPNSKGIGTKVFSYHNGTLQYKELYTVRGFQASSEPMIHFGYGQATKVDSLKILWPNGRYQQLEDLAVNQTLTIKPENTRPFDYELLKPAKKELFKKVDGNLGLVFDHKEDGYIDFNRQKLIPYQIADRGPATAIGDLNNDNKPDIFFGGSKFIPSRLFVQSDSAYSEEKVTAFVNDSIKEDVAAVIADFDKNGRNDLYVGSGGGDFYNEMEPLLDSYYRQTDSVFRSSELPPYFENASVVKASDIDQDGDLDLFVGNQAITSDFGKIPQSYLLKNNEGTFSSIKNEKLQQSGMITDALWEDFDGDGQQDLIVIGEWMSPKFFKNSGGELKEVDLLNETINGLWQCIVPFDIDSDGDTDYVLGNWGTNSKFRASVKYPLKMFYSDFDKNGNTETIVAVAKKGKYYPTESLDGLASQIESLRKKFTSYKSFAGKTLEEIFENKDLKAAREFKVTELRSGYLENNDGVYSFIPFGQELQVAPIMALLVYDFDGDKLPEVLAAGNYFGVKPFHGRFDSFSGAMIKAKNDVILGSELGLDLTNKSARSLDIITLNNQPYVLVTFNNDMVPVYELINKTAE
jgi:hypothetical protein